MTTPNTFHPKTNSQSPKEEQLAEIRSLNLDIYASARCDKRNDPLIFWKPVDFDPRFPNTDISKLCGKKVPWKGFCCFNNFSCGTSIKVSSTCVSVSNLVI